MGAGARHGALGGRRGLSPPAPASTPCPGCGPVLRHAPPCPAMPTVGEGCLGLAWHLPCGLRASRSLTSGSASWGRFVFLNAGGWGAVKRYVCVHFEYFYVKNTHTHTNNRYVRKKRIKPGRVIEASGLGGDGFKRLFTAMSVFQKKGEGHHFEKGGVDWLV